MVTGVKTATIDKISILGISGSGRRGSYNTALLEAAKELAQESITIGTFQIAKLPLYNQDLEAAMPAQVSEFKNSVKESDAILFAVPEHNYTVTAVMKNALEWGARPPSDNSWNEKPCAMMSASSGPRGGARAQLHLRQILVDLNMHPINRPLLLVANEADKFDSNMRLTDSQIRETLRVLLTRLEEWTRTLQNKREKIVA
jgi:chromate reductase